MNDPHLINLPALEPGRVSRSPFGPATTLSHQLRVRLGSERGAATAEYAITTLAAVGFAGLLVVVLRSGEVRGMPTDTVRSALSIPA